MIRCSNRSFAKVGPTSANIACECTTTPTLAQSCTCDRNQMPITQSICNVGPMIFAIWVSDSPLSSKLYPGRRHVEGGKMPVIKTVDPLIGYQLTMQTKMTLKQIVSFMILTIKISINCVNCYENTKHVFILIGNLAFNQSNLRFEDRKVVTSREETGHQQLQFRDHRGDVWSRGKETGSCRCRWGRPGEYSLHLSIFFFI